MRSHILAAAVLTAFSAHAQAYIDIQFDYSYDSAAFFSDPGRKSVLELAAGVFESNFADSLSAIASSGSNRFDTLFFNPGDPGVDIMISSDSIAANVIRVYAGGYNFGGGTLGLGGPGGFSCSGFGSFCTDAGQRGQGNVSGSGAFDFAPWGGAISFNTMTNWHFGETTLGLDAGEFDFYSVALHELAHVLGFGTSDSFANRVSGTNFVGAAVGSAPLDPDRAHWAVNTQSLVNGAGQEAAMTPFLTNRTRKHFTDLDFAAMQDIGWQVTPVPEADTWAMLLAGLGLVGFAARRRLA